MSISSDFLLPHTRQLVNSALDIRTASRFFLRFSFFSSLCYRYFLFSFFLFQASYLSYNRLFLDFFFNFLTFSVPFKTFLVCLCTRLNWQLACQFFGANRQSYRVV